MVPPEDEGGVDVPVNEPLVQGGVDVPVNEPLVLPPPPVKPLIKLGVG